MTRLALDALVLLAALVVIVAALALVAGWVFTGHLDFWNWA